MNKNMKSFLHYIKRPENAGTIQCFIFDSNGSATSEDLFWKLDALQMFVMDLHWPEPEFARHLEQRLKLMASDMMEACVKRSRSY